MVSFSILFVGNTDTSAKLRKSLDFLRQWEIADVMMYAVGSVRVAEAVLTRDQGFLAVFTASSKPAELGAIRASGFLGPLAVIGETVSAYDQTFYGIDRNIYQAVNHIVERLTSDAEGIQIIDDEDVEEDADGVPHCISDAVLQAISV